MKRIYILTLILFCSVLAVDVTAQKETPPAGGKAKDFKLPAKQTKALPNGLRTTTVQYGNIPKVSIRLVIKTGNVHEAADEVWLANLTGDMMKQGTTQMDFKTLSRKAAAMGGDLSINVGMDQTTVSGSVLSEFAPDFISLVASLVMSPAFSASELDRLKLDMKRSLSVRKSVPQSLAQEKFFQAVYKDHPYGRFFPTEAMIDSYSLQKVKDFYDKNFGAKRSVLYVVGKFDEAGVNAAVAKSFSSWKGGPDINYPPAVVNTTHDTSIVDRKTAPQTTVMVGLPVVAPKDKDYVTQIIANSLLGGSFASRITSNIRENKGYTYSPYSYVQNRRTSSLWIEAADVTSEHTLASLREIEKEIRRLQTEPPSKEELEGIQNYEAGIFVLRNSSPEGIIGQLNFIDLFGLDESYLRNLVENIYKVTPAQVSQLVKDKFNYNKMTLVMVGDKESVEKQIKGAAQEKKAF